MGSLQISNESPLDSHPIPATTDALAITPNDHQYILISKQILQYEMKLKRINIETMSEQSHQENGAITLPTSTMSDWRLVLQDSITTEALLKGCISLFDQIDTHLPLSETEMNHVVRFLEYATLHNQYRRFPHCKVLETILFNEEYRKRNVPSALLKLVCNPSNMLQTVALTFLDASISKSFPCESHYATAVTPFPRHRTSAAVSKFKDAIHTPKPSNLKQSEQFSNHPSYICVQRFFGEIRKDIVKELASLLGLPSTDEADLCLHYDQTDPQTTEPWLKGFECLLGRVSEGTQFSDLETLAVTLFLSNRPSDLKLFFDSDDKFGFKMKDTIVSSSKLKVKTL
ncbi:hypothetical protein BLNAU_18903 [Blattamonas nauphoetae]|uniref:Uncharacterized protein n=1 Tax=Blattamonas nauphoetae TaxID=2049346 RepID=A0ABQ9X319_9EUKA|nr:hypothetical protein BLNAU_18903 [Blattamonas nauphoetae]